jgi:hypothetical protein
MRWGEVISAAINVIKNKSERKKGSVKASVDPWLPPPLPCESLGKVCVLYREQFLALINFAELGGSFLGPLVREIFNLVKENLTDPAKADNLAPVLSRILKVLLGSSYRAHIPGSAFGTLISTRHIPHTQSPSVTLSFPLLSEELFEIYARIFRPPDGVAEGKTKFKVKLETGEHLVLLLFHLLGACNGRCLKEPELQVVAFCDRAPWRPSTPSCVPRSQLLSCNILLAPKTEQ